MQSVWEQVPIKSNSIVSPSDDIDCTCREVSQAKVDIINQEEKHQTHGRVQKQNDAGFMGSAKAPGQKAWFGDENACH